jgi:hypothetical protein
MLIAALNGTEIQIWVYFNTAVAFDLLPVTKTHWTNSNIATKGEKQTRLKRSYCRPYIDVDQ